MPRNGSGVYSYPPGSEAQTLTPASSTSFNSLITDLAAALTGSLSADGQTVVTGAINMGGNLITNLSVAAAADTTAIARGYLKALTIALNGAKGIDTASASTTLIGTDTGNFLHITGTTTINSFGSKQAGSWRILIFEGVLQLTHNATSMILPSAANITTAAGDMAIFVSEGGGNWRCATYQRATGKALVETVSSTPVTSISNSADGIINFSSGTGNVTASFLPAALPAMASLVDGAADLIPLVDVSAANANFKATPNQINHVVSSSSGFLSTALTGTTTIPFDNTIPTSSEGSALTGLTAALTPKTTTNKLRVRATVYLSSSISSASIGVSMFLNGGAAAVAVGAVNIQNNGQVCPINFEYEYTPGAVSAQTFTFRFGGSSASTITINGSGGTALFGGTLTSSVVIEEIRA